MSEIMKKTDHWKAKGAMLSIYITEEAKLSFQGISCKTPRLADGDLKNYIKSFTTFSNKEELSENILLQIGEMLKSEASNLNLFIISAHGDAGAIGDGNGKGIDLRNYIDYFGVLPNHLVIYLSTCKGAYPGPFQAFLKKDEINPIVISPVVEIDAADANEFQHILIDTLLKKSDNEVEIFAQLEQFNSEIKSKYEGHMYVMGMFFRSGKWYPEQGVL